MIIGAQPTGPVGYTALSPYINVVTILSLSTFSIRFLMIWGMNPLLLYSSCINPLESIYNTCRFPLQPLHLLKVLRPCMICDSIPKPYRTLHTVIPIQSHLRCLHPLDVRSLQVIEALPPHVATVGEKVYLEPGLTSWVQGLWFLVMDRSLVVCCSLNV